MTKTFPAACVPLTLALVAASVLCASAQTPGRVRIGERTIDIVRWHPRAPSDIIATVEPGTILEVLDEDKGYYWVITPRDDFGTRRGGWVPVRFTEPVEEAAVVTMSEPAAPAPAADVPPPARAASETPKAPAVATPKTYQFEDVLFERDASSLGAEATRILDRAVSALADDRQLRLTIEGHTCSLGTAEYNLSLGDRRASAVTSYLVSRGVTAERLNQVSVGEERPKHDNGREDTRRLNRRVVLVPR